MKDKLGVWCDECETEFASVVTSDSKELCSDCFIETITDEYDGTYQYTETHYMLGGEYIGNEDNFNAVLEKYADNFGAKVLEDEED